MADEERDERTEQASQRRIKAAWEEGQVALGRDLSMAAGLAGGIAALTIAGRGLCDALLGLFSEALRTLPQASLGLLGPRLLRPALIVLGICAAASVASLAATVAQTKGNLWPHLAMPDPSRVLQGGRLRRLFTREVLADLGLSLVKVVALSAVLWQCARGDLLTLGRIALAPPSALLEAVFAPLARASLRVVLAMAILAGLDLALTRYRFNAKMKMTRQEAKREHREEEGDPLVRSRRRRRHRDLLKGRARVEVPKADALVVNPTHIAIAIRYRKDEGKAPRVTAKGKGELAEHMRELARENGIPIIEDIPLARLLWKRVKVGREVPAETYRAVAAILAFVYRATGRTPGMAA